MLEVDPPMKNNSESKQFRARSVYNIESNVCPFLGQFFLSIGLRLKALDLNGKDS